MKRFSLSSCVLLFVCICIGGCSRQPSHGVEEDPALVEIRNAPMRLTDFNVDRGKYIKDVCGKITQTQDLQLCVRRFEILQDCAFSIRFEEIGDLHADDVARRQVVASRLGMAYTSLESLCKEMFVQMVNVHASTKDAFKPLFRFYEKMRAETSRVGFNVRGCPGTIDYIERMYGALIKSKSYRPDEFEWVEAEFLKIAGRPIRTLEEASAARAKEG